jgi:hypothetical protein
MEVATHGALVHIISIKVEDSIHKVIYMVVNEKGCKVNKVPI